MATDPTSRRPTRVFRLLWLLGTSAALLSGVWSSLTGTWPLWHWDIFGRPARTSPQFNWSFDAPGIRQPAALPAAAAAELDDDEAVIGVSAGGHDRAYLVRSLSTGPSSHIVNDVLGGVPVSVTYCDLSECSRVYTGGTSGEPLDLSQGGLKSGSMVLKAKGHPYHQESGTPLEEGAPPFPYAPYPGDVTMWGVWRRRHPDTDIYVAASSPLASPRPPTSGITEAIDTLPHLLHVLVAPLLIVIVTLLVHVLLALLLRPRRQRDPAN